MDFKRCERKQCRSRNSKAVFQVDGHKLCLHCFEKILETSSIDQHRITRLSDREVDFRENTHCMTGRVATV